VWREIVSQRPGNVKGVLEFVLLFVLVNRLGSRKNPMLS
jgi:hypothetical protein